MTSLREAVAQEDATASKGGWSQLKIDRILDTLDEDDATYLRELLADGTRTATSLERILRAAEIPASVSAINNWRKVNNVVTL